MIPPRPSTDERPADAAMARDLGPFFAAARETACRLPEPAVQWDRVSTLVRRRRRLRLAAAVAGALCLCTASAGLGYAAWAAWGGPAEAPGAPPLAPAVAREFSTLFPADGIRIIVDPSATFDLLSPALGLLRSGTVWVGIEPAAERRAFAVRTADVLASAAGTVFRVTVEPQGGSEVAVFEGVVVVHAGGGFRSVAAGMTWTAGDAALRPAVPSAEPPLLWFLLAGPAPAGTAERAPTSPRSEQDPAGETAATVQAQEAVHGATSPCPTVPPRPAAGEPADRVPAVPEPFASPAAPAEPETGASVPPAAAATPGELYVEVDRALAEGRAVDAVALLERVADLAPGSLLSGMALLDLAARSLDMGRPERAAAAYERYLAEQPAGELRGEARISLCRILRRERREADAHRCYAEYLTEQATGTYAAEATRGVAAEERLP